MRWSGEGVSGRLSLDDGFNIFPDLVGSQTITGRGTSIGTVPVSNRKGLPAPVLFRISNTSFMRSSSNGQAAWQVTTQCLQ